MSASTQTADRPNNMREYSLGTPSGLDPILPGELAQKLVALGPQKKFEKNAAIYDQGAQAEYVYFLGQGRVKSILASRSGQQSILRIHLPHSILGLTALASEPVRDASAICMDEVIVVPISRDEFTRLMSQEPSIGIHIVRLLADRMSDFHHRVGDWLDQPVEQRLAGVLLAISDPVPDTEPAGNAATVPVSHEELAQLINARRPTVSSALSRFADLGAVYQEGRQLHVTDRRVLMELSQGPEEK